MGHEREGVPKPAVRAAPPSDMIQIFIAGDADTRKKNEPPPPAGYGAVATEAGNEIFTIGGMIAAGRTPNVKTTTGNLADLVAFTRALQWALQNSRARGRPICIRYNSEYAAAHQHGRMEGKEAQGHGRGSAACMGAAKE